MADIVKDTVLTKIAAHLETNPDVTSYTVDGVTVSRANILDLLEARSRILLEKNSVDQTKDPIQYFRRGPR